MGLAVADGWAQSSRTADGRTPEQLSGLDLANFRGITLGDFELPAQCLASEGDLATQDGVAEFFDPAQLADLNLPNLATLTPYRLPAGQRALRPEWRVAPVVRGVTTTTAGWQAGTLKLPGIPQASERALGMTIGTGGNLSLSTEVASDNGSWGQANARWGWSLRRQASDSDRGFVWGGSTSGRVDMQGGRNQDMDLRLGFRRGSSEGDWLFMPQLSVSSSYQPTSSERWGATTLKPSVTATARVFGTDQDWVSAKVDTRVGYAIPVAASAAGQLDVSAMLRLTFRGLQ